MKTIVVFNARTLEHAFGFAVPGSFPVEGANFRFLCKGSYLLCFLFDECLIWPPNRWTHVTSEIRGASGLLSRRAKRHGLYSASRGTLWRRSDEQGLT